MINSNLFTVNKLAYATGNRPEVECILCAIVDKDPKVTDLIVYEGNNALVCVNLYPYNTGHVMVFPKRHLTDIRQYNEKELLEIEDLSKRCMDALDILYKPSGFNIGYNIGNNSGASIAHLHRHVIPRYLNEIGVIDIIGGAKIIVEDPIITKNKFIEVFKPL